MAEDNPCLIFHIQSKLETKLNLRVQITCMRNKIYSFARIYEVQKIKKKIQVAKRIRTKLFKIYMVKSSTKFQVAG
jgi:hypothetical protein